MNIYGYIVYTMSKSTPSFQSRRGRNVQNFRVSDRQAGIIKKSYLLLFKWYLKSCVG